MISPLTWSSRIKDWMKIVLVFTHISTCFLVCNKKNRNHHRCLTFSSSLSSFCTSLGHNLHRIFWNALAEKIIIIIVSHIQWLFILHQNSQPFHNILKLAKCTKKTYFYSIYFNICIILKSIGKLIKSVIRNRLL